MNTYNEDANKIGLDISMSDFEDNLKSMESELKSLLSPLSLKERANLSGKVQLLERKVPQVKEFINHFVGNLESLDINAKNVHSWSESEIKTFLEKISEEQVKTLKSLEEREELTFKALSSLDQAKDEFKLLTYQKNLEKQKKHLKVLNENKHRIEEDCAALQEALSQVKTSMDSLNNKMIEELFDTVQKIFTHINSHPLYNKLKFSKEHRNKAYRLLIHVLTGESEAEIPANASYIFSSAQVNSIALSFFIAMALH